MKNETCKKCKGLGKVPTYEKEQKFMGINISGPSLICCAKCHGTGRK